MTRELKEVFWCVRMSGATWWNNGFTTISRYLRERFTNKTYAKHKLKLICKYADPSAKLVKVSCYTVKK